MRAGMFGVLHHNRKAQDAEKPIIAQEAADGHLFHTASNIPVDVRLYVGFDSNNDEEDGGLRSLLMSNEVQLNEFIDVPAREKYFFTLWARFASEIY